MVPQTQVSKSVSLLLVLLQLIEGSKSFSSLAAPQWPEDLYEIAKMDTLHKKSTNNQVFAENKYFSLELHVLIEGDSSPDTDRRRFRIFTHQGNVSELDSQTESGHKECRYTDNVDIAEGVYSFLYEKMVSQGYKKVLLMSGSKIGSPKALKDRARDKGSFLSDKVWKLVETIYAEANSKLYNNVDKSLLGNLHITQIEQAEAILLQVHKIVKEKSFPGERKDHLHQNDAIQQENNNDSEILSEAQVAGELETLEAEFYSILPQKHKPAFDSLAVVEEKIEIVQLLKDMISVSNDSSSLCP